MYTLITPLLLHAYYTLWFSELKNELSVVQANLKQATEDLHIEKENYKWAQTRVSIGIIYFMVSLVTF